MTDFIDYNPIMDVIVKGITVARNNPLPDDGEDTDRYIAWCAVQELRRAGWIIKKASD
ncbi:hypothetical protein SAMN05518849_105103 [Sphingobium sp. AP50]|uniref:hypothetical protein n=1 Tax=Sphingobium sp. AP50 TaxID=1884369 RepID=UPI0008BD04AD|nr:hypothetical protein [Sphingobium sp. AP50]SEJ33695.1 hypothetical protein SAMN05518849_105103 [Sphingobium sp. AP50]